MPKVTINGKELAVKDGLSVLQACEVAGYEIPRFCYHSRLSVAGNCRMCLVEIKGTPKPVASCSMPISDGMIVNTNTAYVKHAREGVMELLLINHPLDCPICDRGGECDLQDQAMTYGRPYSRYDEEKRAVKDKYLGPLVATHMTRCIHCTRCIRFATEIAGVEEMGTEGRGENIEVMSYVNKAVTSELSGNMIDICPVGALTSKPMAFKGRSWEFKKTESIDILDAIGSNIRIDSRELEIMRIVPRLNEGVNEEWISDKTRFSYDGLRYQRLDRPYIRVDGKLREASWEEAINMVKEKIQSTSAQAIASLVGDFVDAETIIALKDLMDNLGVKNLDCRIDGSSITNSCRSHYLFNTTIEGIEKSDLCLFIGSNPRQEATIINARFRKRYLKKGFSAYALGKPDIDFTYPVEDLGSNINSLIEIVEGKHLLSEKLSKAANPMIVIGSSVLQREDSYELLKLCQKLAEKYNMIRDDWNGFNILHTAASRVGALDLGFLPSDNGLNYKQILEAVRNKQIEVLYLVGVDSIPAEILRDTFVVYQGHHGDVGATNADVILPGAAYTEKNATYVNLEGRVQETSMALQPLYMAKEDWKIVKMLAHSLNIILHYNTLPQIRTRLEAVNSIFGQRNKVIKAEWSSSENYHGFSSSPIEVIMKNYYMDNVIGKYSKIMLSCTKELLNQGKVPA
jgi:NADH-quinone oxidoreductase subunit G